MLLAGVPAMRCGHPVREKDRSERAPSTSQVDPGPEPQDTSGWNHPYFGFNAKGSVDADQQTAYVNKFFDQINNTDIKKDIVVRVTGGTISQTTSSTGWSDSMIKAWTDVQKRQGIHFIYVVNGNDSPVDQAGEIQRWLDAGAHFDMLEMMNEYYLPKYAKGDLSKPEVTSKVTAESYVNDILPKFWKELDRFNLPYYLIFAPSKPDQQKANDLLMHWNEVVADAINNKYANKQLNATLHLYLRGAGDISGFDYDQIDRVRKQLPSGRHIAITEAGVIDPSLDTQQAGEISIQHYKNILKHLLPGDYLLDQVLYNPSKKSNTAALSPEAQGETLKGKAVLQFINNRLR